MVPRPVLGSVPSPYAAIDADLTIKCSHTGITLLTERRYKQRYTGSKTCAVDINGKLYTDAKDLEKLIKDKSGSPPGRTKKNQGRPPGLEFTYLTPTVAMGSGAISENNADPGNFATNIANKLRKKSYSVNKKEVRQRLLGYINTQKGRKELYFWTVSFPEGTPDAVCYQAYNTWLTALRQRNMLKDYLWVAERQDGKRNPDGRATNTIHFHIAIPHFMNVQRANAMMRGTLKTYAKRGDLPGAVVDLKTKKQISFLSCIAKYNGVDIAKHRKTGRVINFAIKKGSLALATYLSKYVTKNNAGVPDADGNIDVPGFDHLAWHNSRGFSCLFTGVTFTVAEFKKFGFGPFLNRVRVFEMNFAKFIPWLYGPPPLLLDHLYQLNSYIQTLHDGTS